MKIKMNKRYLTVGVGFLGLFLIVSGISWVLFSYVIKGTGPVSSTNLKGLASERSKINLDLPKTAECPINGMKYTEIEKNIWGGRRPITAMIENHADSRPPSGLSKTDAVYEAVAEGGITRFLSIFYCGASSQDVEIAPVRSARIYFINWAAEFGLNPIFTHVGGANNICGNCPGGVKTKGEVAKEVQAIEELVKLGWRVPKGNDFDTTYDSGFPVFWRNYERLDHPVATEHTMMSSTDKLFEEAANRGFAFKDSSGTPWNKTFTLWKFADDSPVASPNATDISFEFWSNQPDYDVQWKYDKANNQYLRFNGGKAHTDLEFDNSQLTAKNVVVEFVQEKGPVDTEKHMFYQVIGQGDAIIFQNGTAIKGTWKKATQTSRTIFMDSNGKEISFVRGRIWIEALPIGNTVDYN